MKVWNCRLYQSMGRIWQRLFESDLKSLTWGLYKRLIRNTDINLTLLSTMMTAEKSGHLSTRTVLSVSNPLLSNLRWLNTLSKKWKYLKTQVNLILYYKCIYTNICTYQIFIGYILCMCKYDDRVFLASSLAIFPNESPDVFIVYFQFDLQSNNYFYSVHFFIDFT
jgi:hypothetical protein